MKFYLMFLTLILFTQIGCNDNIYFPDLFSDGKGNNSGEVFSGMLEIKTDKTEYQFSENENMIITAKLFNTTSDTFYTNLGDGFNSSLDQEQLFIVKGSDGFLEKNSLADIWMDKTTGLLFEGTKVVRILPMEEYTVSAHADEEISGEGKFRLRVNYYRQNSTDTLKDVSNNFFIKK